MTEREAIEMFEKAHSLHEQLDLACDIRDIGHVLSQKPIDMDQVRAKIKKVNDEHPENILLNHIIFPSQGTPFPGGYIPDQTLINDLTWKHIYLQAKKAGKAFDELCKEMRKI